MTATDNQNLHLGRAMFFQDCLQTVVSSSVAPYPPLSMPIPTWGTCIAFYTSKILKKPFFKGEERNPEELILFSKYGSSLAGAWSALR